jgi:hypothetical protein
VRRRCHCCRNPFAGGDLGHHDVVESAQWVNGVVPANEAVDARETYLDLKYLLVNAEVMLAAKPGRPGGNDFGLGRRPEMVKSAGR